MNTALKNRQKELRDEANKITKLVKDLSEANHPPCSLSGGVQNFVIAQVSYDWELVKIWDSTNEIKAKLKLSRTYINNVLDSPEFMTFGCRWFRIPRVNWSCKYCNRGYLKIDSFWWSKARQMRANGMCKECEKLKRNKKSPSWSAIQ